MDQSLIQNKIDVSQMAFMNRNIHSEKLGIDITRPCVVTMNEKGDVLSYCDMSSVTQDGNFKFKAVGDASFAPMNGVDALLKARDTFEKRTGIHIGSSQDGKEQDMMNAQTLYNANADIAAENIKKEDATKYLSTYGTENEGYIVNLDEVMQSTNYATAFDKQLDASYGVCMNELNETVNLRACDNYNLINVPDTIKTTGAMKKNIELDLRERAMLQNGNAIYTRDDRMLQDGVRTEVTRDKDGNFNAKHVEMSKIDMAKANVKSFSDKAYTTAAGFAAMAKTKISNGYEKNIHQNFVKGRQQVSQFFADVKSGKVAKDMGNKIQSATMAVSNKIIGSKAYTAFGSCMNNIKTAGKNVMTAGKGAVDKVASVGKDAVDKVATTGKNAMTAGKNAVDKVATNTKEAFYTGVDYGAAAKSVVGNMFSQIKNEAQARHMNRTNSVDMNLIRASMINQRDGAQNAVASSNTPASQAQVAHDVQFN